MTKPTGRKPGRPRTMGRRRDLGTKKKRDRLLRLLRDGYPLDLAADAVGTTGRTVRNEGERDPKFKAEVEDATRIPRSRVELKTFELAIAGDVNAQRIYNRANWPEKYGDKIEISGLSLERLIVLSLEPEDEDDATK